MKFIKKLLQSNKKIKEDFFNALTSMPDKLVITEQKTSNILANAVKFYYEQIIAQLPNNVYWLNKDCTLLGGNENLAKTLGLKSSAELTGLSYKQLSKLTTGTKGQDESFMQDERAVIASGTPCLNKAEPPIIINGETRYFIANKVPLFNIRNEIVGMLRISTDITEIKKMNKPY